MEKTFDQPIKIGNVEITKVTIRPRTKPSYMYGQDGIAFRKKPRIYLSIENYNPIHDMQGERYDKPHKILRGAIPLAMNQTWKGKNIADADAFSLKWNPHAGCSMCPCSPGFVVSGFNGKIGQDDEFQWDAWITYRYVGADAERNPPQKPTEVAAVG